MQIVIDQSDLQHLSPSARAELLALIERGYRAAPEARSQPRTESRAGFRWRAPYDLTPALVKKLLRGMSETSRERLRLFARDSGRVTMQDLLAVTGDEDWRVLSSFQGAVTRKLRRLVGDDGKIVSLIMWDYDAETWDPEHTTLVDGVYYVSERTAKSLRDYFGAPRSGQA